MKLEIRNHRGFYPGAGCVDLGFVDNGELWSWRIMRSGVGVRKIPLSCEQLDRGRRRWKDALKVVSIIKKRQLTACF